MDDEKFDNLGVLAWYSDEVDAIIDTIKIGNAYIGNKPGRKKMYGAKFTENDICTV